MIRRSLRSVAATWLAGLLGLLPLALTLAVLAYAFDVANRLVGPGSLVGRFFAALGYPFSRHPGLAYLFGTLRSSASPSSAVCTASPTGSSACWTRSRAATSAP
jgi:hypothetical protein